MQVLTLSLVWPIKQLFFFVLMTRFDTANWMLFIAELTDDLSDPYERLHYLSQTSWEHSKQDTSMNQQSADTSTVWRHVTDTAEWLKQSLPFTHRQQTHTHVHLSSNAESLSFPEDKVRPPLVVHHRVSRQTGTGSVEHRVYVESSTLSKLHQPNMSWTRLIDILRD